jgi:Protein of unknown function (DUF3306)
MAETEPDDGFLTRWSRRKTSVRQGQPVPAVPTVPAPAAPVRVPAPQTKEATAELPPAPAAPPPPTLEDVERLTPSSDFSRFVAPQVMPDVRNAALKKLFTDPHFNVMDGLDTYIEDFGKPDPLPAGMLRKMMQSQLLNLFADDKPAAGPAAAASAQPLAPETPADEDPALRLQPHDAAGPPGPEPGAVEDAGGQR